LLSATVFKTCVALSNNFTRDGRHEHIKNETKFLSITDYTAERSRSLLMNFTSQTLV